MDSPEHSTQMALLFPLQAGLCFVKAASPGPGAGLAPATAPARLRPPAAPAAAAAAARVRMRRGSSLTELDRVAAAAAAARACAPIPPPASAAVSEPHSPASLSASRRLLAGQPVAARGGSIGDLMNWKRYGEGGSAWSVGTTESLVARTVPLSTVTPRTPRTPTRSFEDPDDVPPDLLEGVFGLSCAQRTERLSQLIRQQQKSRPLLIHAETIAVS